MSTEQEIKNGQAEVAPQGEKRPAEEEVDAAKGTQWEKAEFGGDQEKKAKFLKLMGANKTEHTENGKEDGEQKEEAEKEGEKKEDGEGKEAEGDSEDKEDGDTEEDGDEKDDEEKDEEDDDDGGSDSDVQEIPQDEGEGDEEDEKDDDK